MEKRRTIPVIAAIVFYIMACCFQSPVFAKAAKGAVTEGKDYYREFLVDNVLHSPKDGDIHYHVYFPDSYNGKKKMALYVTLPGYQGLYFQGVAENLKTEDFAFEAKKYNKDMIILAPQLDDWGETSARQTIALVEYFLENYPVDPENVYINGYSGGGETLSLILEMRPELFARALMCSSQWDGEYGPVVKARTPVYFVIGQDDEYYSSKPFRDAYQKLYGLYQKEGLSEKEIKKLLVLDVKGSDYFKGTGITYQHGGGWLFCRDEKIMNWLFTSKKAVKEKAAKKQTVSITLNKPVYTLKKGKTVKLKATLNKAAKKKGVEWKRPAGIPLCPKEWAVIWKSSKPKIASVSKNGKVTAKKNGKATITARIKGTKVKAASKITVGMPISKIRLNRKSVSLKAGQKFTLKTTVSPKKVAVKKVSYESSNSKVATVSKKGVIRAVSAGTTKITVTAADGSGKKASCTVRVSESTESTVPVASIRLNKTQLNLKQGGEERLTATVNPSNATDKTIRWASSNQAVARVSDNGTVKAVAAGTATITASAENGVRAVCNITVEASPVQPEEPVEPGEGKILVAYFSWSGTSERIANNIIEQTGADSFRIERETPYSDDYNEVAYGEAKDEADNNARPPIKNPLASVGQYDRIVLCYPIWWHTAPMTVGTFLESYNFTGKHIYPVSQSASMDTSQYAQSVEFIKTCALGAIVDDGLFSKDNSVIRSYIADTVM